MNSDLSQDPSLVEDFLVESEEFLQRMDQDMVALEATPQDGEVLNRIFRAMHTIKGTSGFMGFDAVAQLSHRVEDVLNALRNSEIQLDRRCIDAMLAARDQLGGMLQDIRKGESEKKEYQISELLAELEEVQKAGRAAASAGEGLNEAATAAKSASAMATSNDAAEEQVSKPAAADASTQTLRVDTRKLDELVNLIGELVIERNRLVQLSRDCSAQGLADAGLQSSLGESSARLSLITDELQSAGLKTRMVPIETVFRRFPRLVRDVARNLRKDVQLVIQGEDTELDKTMGELIGDPLVHLVRNSLDHGIESPDERERAGKPRQGTIRLEARQEGDQIVISLADDGAGISAEAVGRRAVERGFVSAERLRLLSSREILDFIFLPGFSTAGKISDLSGRGVGLDVVRSNLKKLNGLVEMETRPGAGTTVLLRLPLTLAILPVLLVRVGEETYALPLRAVVETAQINVRQIHRVEGCEVLCLRDETLPLIRLAQVFESRPWASVAGAAEISQSAKVVILGIAEKRVALLVDHLLGQESTVVKPLGNYLHGCSSLAGASIGGDGRVRLVLDVAGLLAASKKMAAMVRRASA